jgi:phospholipase/carboxylesterase
LSVEPLPSVEVTTGDPVQASVIWLHGLGADGHDFEPIVPLLRLDSAPGVRFVFPHAPSRPVTINAGMVMPAWYDIRVLALRRDVDAKGVAESSSAIESLLERERERGVPSERIVLAGFSQGGALALHVALRHASRLAGVVALSCYLVLEETLASECSAVNAGLPIFQGHGTDDPMVPLQAGEQARDTLLEAGYPVDWRTYPMGHQVLPQEIADVGQAIRRMLGSPGL